jgi:hypothetical protein|tara:strand:- start:1430 stop:2353 length:924 start_codon:yes stop_codon:yes gene_type:complete
MAGYIGKKAALTVGVSATVTELNYNDTGSAVGTVVASKTVTADANKDVASFRNITLTGELDAGSLDVSGNADIDGTLETDALSIDGTTVTTTAAEINLIDGGTARGTTALADGDGLLVNDAGTMRMTTVQTVKTYMTSGVGGGGTEFIASSGAISDAANVSFTQFDASKYDHYQFWFQHVIPATDVVELYGYVSTDGGSSYDTTNGNYHLQNTTDQPGLRVAESIGSDTNEFGICGYFELFAPHNSSSYTMSSSGNITYQVRTAGGIYQLTGGSIHLVAADVDAIQFAMSSGNIESGEITMFGIVNS